MMVTSQLLIMFFFFINFSYLIKLSSTLIRRGKTQCTTTGWSICCILLQVFPSVFKWTCILPVCRRMWTFMLPEVEKHFRQDWHSNALTPVCVFMCAVRVLLTAKALKHCLHLKGFSWVWIRMCRTRSLGFLNSLEQYGQPCQRTPFSSLIEPEKAKDSETAG